MKDVMDQWAKTFEKMWGPWQQMMGDPGWFPKPEMPFQGQWSSWMAAMRSTYEVNMTWWQTFMEQGETVFFKAFKESPFYSAAVEDQIREAWEAIKKTQAAQQKLVKEQFEKIENLLKEGEEAR